MKPADGAGDHGIGKTQLDHHRRLGGFTVTQYFASFRQCFSTAFGQAVKFKRPFLVFFIIHDFVIRTGPGDKTILADDRLHYLLATQHDRKAELILDNIIDRLQNLGIFSLCKYHLALDGSRHVEHRFHK